MSREITIILVTISTPPSPALENKPLTATHTLKKQVILLQ
jgi:hypothetical protein